MRPFDLIQAALKGKGVSVQFVSPDEPQLDGGDAKYVPIFGCILVRNDVSLGRKAELLAHEFGHIIVHQSEHVCEVDSIDITAQEEGALARANAYGPRERRELQANVFAREFLLPREFARELFLFRGLTAEEIARQLEIEPSIVRLQLVDALLTNEPVENKAANETVPVQPQALIEDKSQDRAAEQSGQAFLLEAGPGSGKTRTLVKRVNWLLSQDIPSHQILALTFSNKAAAELSNRIAQKDPQAALQLWSGTFHAFGYELIKRHYDVLGLPPSPRLIGKTEALELLEDRLPVMDLSHFHDLRSPASQLDEILNAISRAKDELVEVPQFQKLAQNALLADPDNVPAQRADEAGCVYEEYERAKRDLGLVDFGDLVMVPTLLLMRNDEIRKSEAERYREVLVDEYQDVNRASAEMLKAFFREGSRLWVVGDARQSIYRFRGASSRNMELFEEDFPGGTRKPLNFNYRSSEPVVEVCRAFASDMQAGHEKSLPYTAVSHGPQSSDMPYALVTDSTGDVGDAVATEIFALVEQGVKFTEQVILSPTNDRLDEVAANLASAGIPTVHLGSFFEREEVRDLLSLLSIVAEPAGTGLARIGKIAGTQLSSEDIRNCLRASQEAEKPLVELLSDLSQVKGISETGKKSLDTIRHQIKGFSKDSNAYDLILTWLLDRTDYLGTLAAQNDVVSSLSKSAILKLLEVIRDRDLLGRPLTASGVLERIRSIMILKEDKSFKEAPIDDGVDAVRLMTIHGAKGLEFKAVHILDMNEETFPGKAKSDKKPLPSGIDDEKEPNASHLEERECQFFVAISRAEQYLRLYRSNKVNTSTRTRSRFLDRIGCPERFVEASERPVLAPRSKPICETVEALSAQDLREYEQCPLKIVYRRSMGIRTRRHESPFLRTTSVVYGVIDELPSILSQSDVEAALTDVTNDMWSKRGPVGHSLEASYRTLASRHITSLQRLVTGFQYLHDSDLIVELPGGQFKVRPPLVTTGGGGKTIARFIEAGSASSKSGDYHADRMKKLAAHESYGASAVIEIAHVSDGGIVSRNTRASTLQKARELAGKVLEDMKIGNLHPKPSRHVCIRCPYFFACPGTGHEK
ncbi:UvrD-helicase domain-containing protein [Labrenzia sp. R5_0]|uniref:UvrD-helicase domain-containing protein n=1 Tax=Labrenzia sp. R5_0 TaxID=2821108 RepID=UPI001ADC2413|nr:UvrD-helicase domain-containing protein [Labrenzia sp. R5_0]MBO9461164.1 UvrD-helicase domain-containing protein [Labrenzia sp. R5_0]